MARQKTVNPYLDKVLDEYRSAVKTWGRHTLLTTFVFLLTGLFFVSPAVRWSDKKGALEEKIRHAELKRQRIESIITDVEGLEAKFVRQRERIAAYGQDLARDLSTRLSVFSRAVRALRKDEEVLITERGPESFPGALLAEQFAQPSDVPVPLDPWPLLMVGYQLSNEDIALIKEAVPGSPKWDKATEVVRSVYYGEIDHIYSKLNEGIGKALNQLKIETEATLKTLSPRVGEFGIELPGADEIIPRVPTIRRPLDDSLFQTREGKREALREDTQFVAFNFDVAKQPLRTAYEKLVSSAKRLEEGFADLQLQHDDVLRALADLDNQVTEAAKHLSHLSVPFDWIPLAIGIPTLVRVYPIFFAVLFFLLVRRLLRLGTLRERLYGDCERQGMLDNDINLVLHTPYTTFAWFTGFEVELSKTTRVLRLIAPVLVLGFLVMMAWYVESSPSFGTRYSVFLHLSAVALSIWGGYYLFRFLFRPPSSA